jgi:hypothetical protein
MIQITKYLQYKHIVSIGVTWVITLGGGGGVKSTMGIWNFN